LTTAVAPRSVDSSRQAESFLDLSILRLATVSDGCRPANGVPADVVCALDRPKKSQETVK